MPPECAGSISGRKKSTAADQCKTSEPNGILFKLRAGHKIPAPRADHLAAMGFQPLPAHRAELIGQLLTDRPALRCPSRFAHDPSPSNENIVWKEFACPLSYYRNNGRIRPAFQAKYNVPTAGRPNTQFALKLLGSAFPKIRGNPVQGVPQDLFLRQVHNPNVPAGRRRVKPAAMHHQNLLLM
jgi:hypothetical protein